MLLCMTSIGAESVANANRGKMSSIQMTNSLNKKFLSFNCNSIVSPRRISQQINEGHLPALFLNGYNDPENHINFLLTLSGKWGPGFHIPV
ncbi:hypothetical protein SBDP1_220035 [Syntrophobacter sp. SbD1]|nr:hypothetical protein SBDP1_220035 [Syntrophobacter sp. SbD1]